MTAGESAGKKGEGLGFEALIAIICVWVGRGGMADVAYLVIKEIGRSGGDLRMMMVARERGVRDRGRWEGGFVLVMLSCYVCWDWERGSLKR